MINKYILKTSIEDSNIGQTYLKDKFYHVSLITSEILEAMQFDTKKIAKKYLEANKMDLNQWKIKKI